MKDINATVIVDLTRSEDEIFQSLRKQTRTGIRKGMKRGLVVEESDDWEKAYNVYEEAREKNGLKAHGLEDLKRWSDRLFVCRKDGKIIAVNITWFVDIYDKNIPRALTNATLSNHTYERPNELMYWHIFKYYKAKGYDKFDLGGYAIKTRENLEQVNKFKKNFGDVVYFYRDYPVHKAIGRKLVRNSDLLWNLNKILRSKRLLD